MLKGEHPAPTMTRTEPGRATAAEVAVRLAERDARLATDDRTPAQQWLNDPPPWRRTIRQRSASA